MSVIQSVTFDKCPSLKVQFLINCCSGFEVPQYFCINTENKSAINSCNKLETSKKIPYGFAITVLFSPSTYCKPGSAASILLFATAVKSNKQFLPQKLNEEILQRYTS